MIEEGEKKVFRVRKYTATVECHSGEKGCVWMESYGSLLPVELVGCPRMHLCHVREQNLPCRAGVAGDLVCSRLTRG